MQPVTTLKVSVYISLAVILLCIGSMVVLNRIKPPEPATTVIDKRIESSVRLALLNGCGREGMAGHFTDILRSRGYDVVNGRGDNADSFDFDRSVVVDRKGIDGLAQLVAEDLGISLVIKQ